MPLTLLRSPSICLYFLCQSITLITAVMAVAVVGSVGSLLAPSPLYATVPYGMQFFLLMVGSYPASWIMKVRGRKFGFYLGAFFLILSGLVGYFAIEMGSFLLLILAHGLIGLFTACANFYRYAATDGVPASLQSQVLSLVVAGGVMAGFVGPALSTYVRDLPGFPEFSLCYGALIPLSILNMALIYFLPSAPVSSSLEGAPAHHSASPQDRTMIFFAISIAAFGYAVMNLLMIQSSLMLGHRHASFEETAFAIQWHVVAMFFPSFVTGFLIARLGHFWVIGFGLALFMASFSINIADPSYDGIVLSLILLGLGWNFTYVGGSSLLASVLVEDSLKQKWQGIGETAIAVCATVGALSPSFLLQGIGWQYTNALCVALCAVPLLALLSLKGRGACFNAP